MSQSSHTIYLKIVTTLIGALGIAIPVAANQASPATDQSTALFMAATDEFPAVSEDSEGLESAADGLETEAIAPNNPLADIEFEGLEQRAPAINISESESEHGNIRNDDILSRPEGESFSLELLRTGEDESPPAVDPFTEASSQPNPAITQYRLPDSFAEPDVPEADLAPQIEVFPVGDSSIPRDGRSTLTIGGQITDETGALISHDVVVTLTSSSGEFIGADYNTDRPGFQVLARQGAFEARLRSRIDAEVMRSSLEQRLVRIRAAVDGADARGFKPGGTREFFPAASYPELEAFTQVEFITERRPFVISGLLDFRIGRGGVDFFGSFEDFLNPDILDDDVEVDVDSAIFATGSLGEWLFTGAFNSDRALNERCDGNGLYQDVQFCDQQYPVYGDSSTTDFLTPSIDSFYARLQRDSIIPGGEPDYIMWGDYDTPEFARASQDFTALIRQLHGFKANYTFDVGGGLQLTALAANNLNPFQRDTIAPDGTSGLYFLSQRLVLRGSEVVTIETEEFNRPGTVIESRTLTRGADYEIDYDRGSLLFRQPIHATELNPLGLTLVQKIVVTYQLDSGGDGGNLYAGRLQYNFTPAFEGNPSWIAATYQKEDLGTLDFDLYGFDFLISLGGGAQITGELARSSQLFGGDRFDGGAYSFEASGNLLPGLRGRAYFRSVDDQFSNNATTSFSPGQTRFGGELAANLGPNTQIQVQYDEESNFGFATDVLTSANALLDPGQSAQVGDEVNNTLRTFRAGIQQRWGAATLGLDYVHRGRSDRIDSTSTSSNQLVPRFALPITSFLSFRGQSEINFTGESDPLYPTRTTLGLDWAVEPGITIRLAQQFLAGGQGPNSITSLDTIVDHKLGDNTSLTSRYSLLGGYNGVTGQAALGLNHRVTLAPGLRLNLGLERIMGDAFNLTGAGQEFEQAFAVGQSAASLGLLSGTTYIAELEYTNNPDFQFSGRFQYRDSKDQADNTVIGVAAAGKITPALTGLLNFEMSNFANQTITGELGDTANLRLGLAYRNPHSDFFNGLLSYEYRSNPSTTPDTITFGEDSGSTDHTFALEGIVAPNWQWEFYGKYAFRLSETTAAEDFSTTNLINLGQFRATYRFGYRWDVTGGFRLISQPQADFFEAGAALELGYYLTPELRLGVGYSFGHANDNSFGGNGSRTANGPFFGISFKVNELFNGFGRQPVSPPQQEESLIEITAVESPVAHETAQAGPETDEVGAGFTRPQTATISAPNREETTPAKNEKTVIQSVNGWRE